MISLADNQRAGNTLSHMQNLDYHLKRSHEYVMIGYITRMYMSSENIIYRTYVTRGILNLRQRGLVKIWITSQGE